MKDDQELVAGARSGGAEAFAPIVERYQDAVFGVVLARLRNFHDAQDVAQMAFIEAFSRLDKLRDSNRLGAWLRSIAIHKSIDYLHNRRETTDIKDVENREIEKEPRHAHDLRDQVLEAIGRLSKTMAETVTLFYVNGYSVDEVAAMQGAPIGTVKRRLHDARKQLKEEMMKTVEGVLKSEAPKADFGKQVFEMLLRYNRPPVHWPEWQKISARLREIGPQGIEGFIQALESPHSPTRMFAVRMLETFGQTEKTVEELLKRCLGDTNKRVRRTACRAMIRVMEDDPSRRPELMPFVLPFLKDRSKPTRRIVAWHLARNGLAQHVPLEVIAQAVADEREINLKGLLQAVLKAKSGNHTN